MTRSGATVGGDDGDKPNGNGPRRPNDGPPDLEELWRDFNRKLNGMFGNKGGGGGNGGGDGPRMPQIDFNPKFLGGGIGLLVGLAAIVWLASGFYIVDASQRGLVLQFGSFKEPPSRACAGACPIRSSRTNWST
jgi:membrane protease subunit HflK